MSKSWVFYSSTLKQLNNLAEKDQRWGVRRSIRTYLENRGFGEGDRILWVASDVGSIVGTSLVGPGGFANATFSLGGVVYEGFRLTKVTIWSRPRWKPLSLFRNYPTDIGSLYSFTVRPISEQALSQIAEAQTGPSQPALPAHGALVEMIREMGDWEGYHTHREETIAAFKYDVTWRRHPQGEPTRVYEVELSGNISAALTRLKNAHDQWNSELFLVTTPEGEARAKKLLEGPFIDIKERCATMLASDILERHQHGKVYFTKHQSTH